MKKIIICSGKSVLQIRGIADEKTILVINPFPKDFWSKGFWSRSNDTDYIRLPQKELDKLYTDKAIKIADFLKSLPVPMLLQLMTVMKKREKELKREIQERKNRISDMMGSWPNVSDFSRRNRERYAGVLGLDKVKSWNDIKKALDLPNYFVPLAEMQEALRKRIAQELKLSEETDWNGIGLALGLSKPTPFCYIIEALREKRALAVGLPKTASWKQIRNKRKGGR